MGAIGVGCRYKPGFKVMPVASKSGLSSQEVAQQEHHESYVFFAYDCFIGSSSPLIISDDPSCSNTYGLLQLALLCMQKGQALIVFCCQRLSFCEICSTDEPVSSASTGVVTKSTGSIEHCNTLSCTFFWTRELVGNQFLSKVFICAASCLHLVFDIDCRQEEPMIIVS